MRCLHLEEEAAAVAIVEQQIYVLPGAKFEQSHRRQLEVHRHNVVSEFLQALYPAGQPAQTFSFKLDDKVITAKRQ